MSIVVIKGKTGTGKSFVANLFKNNQSSNRKGVLLIDGADGTPRELLSKLLVGVDFPEQSPIDINSLPWKPDPMLILVGDGTAKLSEFESIAPGLTVMLGQKYTITCGESLLTKLLKDF